MVLGQKEVQIVVDATRGAVFGAEPVEHAGPVGEPVRVMGKPADRAGLDEGEGLEQLVEGAEGGWRLP
jgi:hypothetical protein